MCNHHHFVAKSSELARNLVGCGDNATELWHKSMGDERYLHRLAMPSIDPLRVDVADLADGTLTP